MADEINILPNGRDWNNYFESLKEGTSKVPDIPRESGAALSERIMPVYEQAATSDNTPLDPAIDELKLGVTYLKLQLKPPFWAAGYRRGYRPINEEDKND